MAATLGEINPFRYRSYTFDCETGLYYLRSRYFKPTLCRFVNADTVISPGILLCNAFAYCSNNPIKRTDDTGHAWYDGIVNIWNTFTSFLKECFQAQVQADIIAAEQTAYAMNNAISEAKQLWNEAKTAVINWWENQAMPWLNQAMDTVNTLWNNAKEYIKSALQAQQHADIVSAQMTYTAGTNVLNWLSNSWKDLVDWTGIVYTGAVFVLKRASKAGVVVIAPHVATAMTVVDFVYWCYSIGDKLEWW